MQHPKLCPHCGIVKDKLKDFGQKKGKCKPCIKEINDIRYVTDPEYRKRINKTTKDSYDRLKKYVDDYKKLRMCSNPECNENRHYVLDFHHIGKKNDSISNMISKGNLRALIAEMKLCVLFCANCHREAHYLIQKQAKRRNAS